MLKKILLPCLCLLLLSACAQDNLKASLDEFKNKTDEVKQNVQEAKENIDQKIEDVKTAKQELDEAAGAVKNIVNTDKN